jgi:hypothetical protein
LCWYSKKETTMTFETLARRRSGAAKPLHVLTGALGALFGPLADRLRKRWDYYRTLDALHGYNGRALRDIGADQGAKAFARRAAGL